MSDLTAQSTALWTSKSTSPARQFQQVDVFTSAPCLGNPVAVIAQADGLDDAAMQRIARWTNLSETTFVLPPTHPDADYLVRIFTPGAELPFAGHPTLGTLHALRQLGRQPKQQGQWKQQCAAGLVDIAQVDAATDAWAFKLPATTLTTLPVAEHDALRRALNTQSMRDVQIANCGPVWITVELDSADDVRALKPDFAAMADWCPCPMTGITVFGREAATEGSAHDGGSLALEVRSFAPAHGITEDPVCGSGNGCVAAVLRSRGWTGSYQARQGRCIGRDGYIQVRIDTDGAIWVGGPAVTVIEGHIAV